MSNVRNTTNLYLSTFTNTKSKARQMNFGFHIKLWILLNMCFIMNIAYVWFNSHKLIANGIIVLFMLLLSIMWYFYTRMEKQQGSLQNAADVCLKRKLLLPEKRVNQARTSNENNQISLQKKNDII